MTKIVLIGAVQLHHWSGRLDLNQRLSLPKGGGEWVQKPKPQQDKWELTITLKSEILLY